MDDDDKEEIKEEIKDKVWDKQILASEEIKIIEEKREAAAAGGGIFGIIGGIALISIKPIMIGMSNPHVLAALGVAGSGASILVAGFSVGIFISSGIALASLVYFILSMINHDTKVRIRIVKQYFKDGFKYFTKYAEPVKKIISDKLKNDEELVERVKEINGNISENSINEIIEHSVSYIVDRDIITGILEVQLDNAAKEHTELANVFIEVKKRLKSMLLKKPHRIHGHKYLFDDPIMNEKFLNIAKEGNVSYRQIRTALFGRKRR